MLMQNKLKEPLSTSENVKQSTQSLCTISSQTDGVCLSKLRNQNKFEIVHYAD